MLVTYRRHNPKRCRLRSRSDYRCKCPIWVSGTLPGGQRVRKALKGRDWNKAQDEIRRWEVHGERPLRPARITIEEWQKQFLNDADARHLSGETRRKYVLLFKQLDAFAKNKGIVYVDSLDLTAVTEFRSSWTDGPLSASKKLERLRSLLKFAAVRKWIVENPALLLKPPKVKQTPTLPFSTEEMDNILNAADARIRPFILTMRYSGLRISDVTVLRVTALTNALESGSNGRKRAPKYSRLRLYTAKTDEPVSVLIPEHVAKSLSGVQHKNPEHFFWSGRSKLAAAVSLWRKRLADVFTKAKIENGHSHRFRDTFAVSLLEKGVSLENVAMLLGNSPKVAYKHYAPWVKTRQEALDIAVKAALGASKADNSR